MLSERSQSQKIMVPFHEISRKGKSIETESRLAIAGMKQMANEHNAAFGGDGNDLKLDWHDDCS